jgi:hypothetical protein
MSKNFEVKYLSYLPSHPYSSLSLRLLYKSLWRREYFKRKVSFLFPLSFLKQQGKQIYLDIEPNLNSETISHVIYASFPSSTRCQQSYSPSQSSLLPLLGSFSSLMPPVLTAPSEVWLPDKTLVILHYLSPLGTFSTFLEKDPFPTVHIHNHPFKWCFFLNFHSARDYCLDPYIVISHTPVSLPLELLFFFLYN